MDRAYAGAQPRARMGAAEALSRGIPLELVVFVRKTYALLAFSLVLAAAAVWVGQSLLPVSVTEEGIRLGFPRWILWALWGGTFVFSMMGSFARSGARQGEVSVLGLLALVGLVACSGLMLAPTIGMYVGLGMAGTVAAAAIVTAITFTGLTLVVFVTGKDFGFLGKFLLVAGIAFFAAWFVGMFFVQSAGFQWWLAAFGAILFCGYILFDTSSVVHFYGPNNMVVPAVISLYLDIFNLFLMLLYLLTGRRDE
jgi:modulator of FtsH protease